MTEFREQLERAREAHIAERYPGDLAQDVLRGTVSVSRRPRLMLAPLLVSGLAAMLMVGVMAKMPEVRPAVPGPILIDPYPRADLDLVAVSDEELDEVIAEVMGEVSLAMPGMPEFPGGVDVVPDSGEVSIGLMPGLPSLAWGAETFADGGDEEELDLSF